MDQIASFVQERLFVGLLENLFYGFVTSTVVLIGTLVWRNTVKFSDGLGRGIAETFAVFRERRVQAAVNEIAVAGLIYKIVIYLVFLTPLALVVAGTLHLGGFLVLHAMADDASVGSTVDVEQFNAWALPAYVAAFVVSFPIGIVLIRGYASIFVVSGVIGLVIALVGIGVFVAMLPLWNSAGWILPTIAGVVTLLSAALAGSTAFAITPRELLETASRFDFNIIQSVASVIAIIIAFFYAMEMSREPFTISPDEVFHFIFGQL